MNTHTHVHKEGYKERIEGSENRAERDKSRTKMGKRSTYSTMDWKILFFIHWYKSGNCRTGS